MKALRILVVEDDPLIGMLLAEVLEGLGHEVCAIEANEADAVAAAARCSPDLMIVDARLGDESGIAAVDQILCTGPGAAHVHQRGSCFGSFAEARCGGRSKAFPRAGSRCGNAAGDGRRGCLSRLVEFDQRR